MKTLEQLRLHNPYETREMGSSLKYLNRRYHEGKIDFNVYLTSIDQNLQRPFVWTLHQKQELVRSVFYRRPITDLTIINRFDDTLEIIDGKQRLHSLLLFLNNDFGLWFDENEYHKFETLPPDYQKEFENYVVRYTEILEWTTPIPDLFKIQFFNQINFAGTPQDRDHIKSLMKLSGTSE